MKLRAILKTHRRENFREGPMELTKLLLQIGAIIIGWIVVHKLSASRDIDKARREMIAKATDSLNDEMSKLFGIAKEYHTKTRNIEVEDQIKMSLQDLSGRISLLSNVSPEPSDLSMCSRSIVGLRKSITGEHFEDEHNEPILGSAEQMRSITDEILRTKRALQELKQKQFPTPKRKQ